MDGAKPTKGREDRGIFVGFLVRGQTVSVPIHDRPVPEAGDNVVRAMLHNDRPHWAAESLANEARTNRTDTLPKGDCVLALALVHHLYLTEQFPFAL